MFGKIFFFHDYSSVSVRNGNPDVSIIVKMPGNLCGLAILEVVLGHILKLERNEEFQAQQELLIVPVVRFVLGFLSDCWVCSTLNLEQMPKYLEE